MYVQSKKFTNPNTTKDAPIITKLIHQLRQCISGTITTIDGSELKANLVYIATPQKISARLLDEIKDELGPATNVEFLDGPAILKLISKFIPDLFKNIDDAAQKLISNENQKPSNHEISRALRQTPEKNIHDFYNDLSFFVGSVDTNTLMHLEVSVPEGELELNEANWKTARQEIVKIRDNFSVDLVIERLDDTEANYTEMRLRYESDENKSLIEKSEDLDTQIQDNQTEVRSLASSIRVKLERIKSDITKDDVKRINGAVRNLETGKPLSKEDIDPNFYRELSLGLSRQKEIESQRSELDKIKDQIVPPPKHYATINRRSLDETIQTRKEKYFESIEKINLGSITTLELRIFLEDTERTLALIERIRTGHSALSNAIQLNIKRRIQDRVTVPPHKIFDTGYDIAVYGGAGVGKTTTLEVYAERKRKEGRSALYIPLNRIAAPLISLRDKELREGTGSDVDFSESLLIRCALIYSGTTPSPDNIQRVAEVFDSNPTIILDGLDELYSAVPEIIRAISKHKIKHPRSQIIISSRDCVSYLSNIEFLGITLLPFTDQQLESFIVGWFESNSGDAQQLIDTIHKRDLTEHIKTPLLATITCSLVEKGIDAPSSEREIYSERLRLLTGEYDHYKGIERQTNTPDRLRRCAISLAYYMHKKRIRDICLEDALKGVASELGGKYKPDLLESCLADLIDPCNIIVYDQFNHTYSFGHFRFQEHLAAEAIALDRGIRLEDLTSVDWWRGALCIYSQDADISSLVEDVYRANGRIGRSFITLRMMINSSQLIDKGAMQDLLVKYVDQDDRDLDVMLEPIDHHSEWIDLTDLSVDTR